jgi:hypothetical protein
VVVSIASRSEWKATCRCSSAAITSDQRPPREVHRRKEGRRAAMRDRGDMSMAQIARALGVGRTTLFDHLDLPPLDCIPREQVDAERGDRRVMSGKRAGKKFPRCAETEQIRGLSAEPASSARLQDPRRYVLRACPGRNSRRAPLRTNGMVAGGLDHRTAAKAASRAPAGTSRPNTTLTAAAARPAFRLLVSCLAWFPRVTVARSRWSPVRFDDQLPDANAAAAFDGREPANSDLEMTWVGAQWLSLRRRRMGSLGAGADGASAVTYHAPLTPG